MANTAQNRRACHAGRGKTKLHVVPLHARVCQAGTQAFTARYASDSPLKQKNDHRNKVFLELAIAVKPKLPEGVGPEQKASQVFNKITNPIPALRGLLPTAGFQGLPPGPS